MLSNFEFEQLCLKLHIPKKTQELINYIRVSEPVRRVGGGHHNVCGTYPSKKWVTQFNMNPLRLSYQLFL